MGVERTGTACVRNFESPRISQDCPAMTFKFVRIPSTMAIESDQLRKRKLFGQAALGAKQDPDQFIIFPQIKFEMQDIPL